MTVRFAAAASLLALAGLAAPARAEPSCLVPVMGLTVDQCRADASVPVASRADEALRRAGLAAPQAVEATGSLARRPAR